MSSPEVFISHATADDDFVRELRVALESFHIPVWVDSRNLRGGDKLAPSIETAIAEARQVLVVLSARTINSPWVKKEIKKALEVERDGKDGYRVIPLLLPGVEPTALEIWFEEEPLAVPVTLQPGGLMEAMPAILAALGEMLPTDSARPSAVPQKPVAELTLRLSDPHLQLKDGKRQLSATAVLIYEPSTAGARNAESKRYTFNAPLGPIETEELRWYLERYYIWPVGEFKKRAGRVEVALPEWGKALYRAALATDSARRVFSEWQGERDGAEPRLSVLVDPEPPEDATEEDKAVFREAATELLSLPWEILHDGEGYLFQGRDRVRVRRRLPSRKSQPAVPGSLPIRILLVSPRPEDDSAAYIDHRISARPLVEAVEGLGDLVRLFVLASPTFPALKQALKEAADRNEPFDAVHFDGHGVYDRRHGLGALCFEAPGDGEKLEGRTTVLVHADALAAELRGFRVPLFFLEACQGAKAEDDPTASVAARLLDQGVASVVAMSHSVLVETARRFVAAFYTTLAKGSRVGSAMLTGQHALLDDPCRGKIMGAGELRLADWFVPVLFQEKDDPRLVPALPSEAAKRLAEHRKNLSLGWLPPPPAHGFQGRSRELLALERLLLDSPYAVIRGTGGAGKTTLAAELARWLLAIGRFKQAIFVCLEEYTDCRTVLDAMGKQLMPGDDRWSVTDFPNLDAALQPIERALADRPTILVFDNLESVLPAASATAQDNAAWQDLAAFLPRLLASHAATRAVFTSREPLGQPFDHGRCQRILDALDQQDAIRLVAEVLANAGEIPSPADPGDKQGAIESLVASVNCHARALVLLAPAVGRLGVDATTDEIRKIMAELDAANPGDRENSLYASVQLSLARLPSEVQKQIRPLAVFHGGGNIWTMAEVMKVEPEKAKQLAEALIQVGLAEHLGDKFIGLDPALPAFLGLSLTSEEKAATTRRWAEAMRQLTNFLLHQHFQDTRQANHLTCQEQPNLMAMLDWAEQQLPPEELVDLAGRMESLLAHIGQTLAMARTTAARERAMGKLDDWGHSSFVARAIAIDRLLEQGQLQTALAAAKRLLEKCQDNGGQAYEEAAYDTAIAYFKLGQALQMGGTAEPALQSLAEAEQSFHVLAKAGAKEAEHMASICLSAQGNCLCDLGRLEEANQAYQQCIASAERREDIRGLAVDKGNLGKVRLLKGKRAEALKSFEEARDLFVSLGEPDSLATVWLQIGQVHQTAGQFDQAETAYRQSLAMSVRAKNRAGEAMTVAQLGSLYDRMGRLEEAVSFYRQATEIYVELQDLRHEGVTRKNITDTLIKLGRLDEARTEIHRAIECLKPFGHAAEPWTTWGILHSLERAADNPEAARQARQQAIRLFRDYRLAGGENHNAGGKLCPMVAQAIQAGETAALSQFLAQFLAENDIPQAKALIPKLQAILQGSRDPALAEDPDLDYDDAVELELLLRHLAG